MYADQNVRVQATEDVYEDVAPVVHAPGADILSGHN